MTAQPALRPTDYEYWRAISPTARALDDFMTGTGRGLLSDTNAILPGAVVNRGRLESNYFDLSEPLKAANAGQGLATRRTLEALEDLKSKAPDAYRRYMDSDDVALNAQRNLERILSYEKTKGPAREDVKKLLAMISRDKLRGLKEYVERFGASGLPSIAAVLGGGALVLGQEKQGLDRY